MSTSREEQLDALAVQLREAAYFCTKLEDLEIHCEKVAAELARLAATPKAGVDIRPLDWQKTFVDRGDGSKDQSGWEADNGFNGWYSIEMYFGSDSYGWSVQFDTDVIGDFDDPDQAKAAAQKHFEQRISLALLPSVLGGVDQESIATKPTTDPTVASGTEISRRGLSRQEAETACTGAETFIYFMRAGEFIKIGRAKNWRTRLSQMQTGSPYTIQPLLIIPADCELEVQLHARFYRDRFRGEWFHSSPAILAYIKDNLPRCIVASGIVEVIAVIPEWTSREVIL